MFEALSSFERFGVWRSLKQPASSGGEPCNQYDADPSDPSFGNDRSGERCFTGLHVTGATGV